MPRFSLTNRRSGSGPVDNPRLDPFGVRSPQPAAVNSDGAVALPGPVRYARTLIRPPGRWPGLGLGELWRSRAIAVVLARRSLMVRYRETFIGVAWVLIQPIALMSAFAFFFGVVLKRSGGDMPFPVYIFTGLVVWMMVARVLGGGATSISSNAGLLTKIYFPRADLPISVALASIVDLGFGLIALLVLLAVFGIMPTIWVIVLPILTLMALATALGAAFWFSALSVQYRDVDQALPFLTQLWFFGTPIVYESSLFPAQYQPIFWFNPIATAVNGFRWAITGLMPPPPIEAWIISSVVAVLLLVTGYMYFRTREPIMTDLAA